MKLSDIKYFKVRKGYDMDDFVRNHKSVSITFSLGGVYRYRIIRSFPLEVWNDKRTISRMMLDELKKRLLNIDE